MIAWQSQNQDGSGWGVYAQRFNASGSKVGGEFRVNTVTSGDQTSPSVAMDGTGNFTVAWASITPGTGGPVVDAQRYNSLALRWVASSRSTRWSRPTSRTRRWRRTSPAIFSSRGQATPIRRRPSGM